jgi:parallel beta-helix repeat protein
MRRYLFLTVTLVLFFSLAVNAFAATYYVATTGNNNNPGTEAQPWATLTYAESQLSSGDTLIVRGGTYNETLNINVSNTTIQNYPGETPVIDGGGTLPGAGEYGSLVRISYTTGGITLDGFEIKNSDAIGITVKQTDGNTIKNCIIHDVDRQGIVVDTNANNTLIEDCVIHEHNLFWPGSGSDYGSGFITVRNHDTTIRRCEVYNGYGEGIDAGRKSINVIIEYCVVYDNMSAQIYADTSKDIIIRYNLVYGTRNETYNVKFANFTCGTGIGVDIEVPETGYGDGACCRLLCWFTSSARNKY